MQVKSSERWAFRPMGPQDGLELTKSWDDTSANPFHAFAVAGKRFAAAGPTELVFGRTQDLHSFNPTEFTRVPATGVYLVRALASRQVVAANSEKIYLYSPTGKLQWSQVTKGTEFISVHPTKPIFAFGGQGNGHVCIDGEINEMPATNMLWDSTGSTAAIVNGADVIMANEETGEVQEASLDSPIVSASYMGTDLIVADEEKNYIYKDGSFQECPELVGPFGDDARVPSWYLECIQGWTKKTPVVAVCAYSRGTDINLCTPSELIELMDDDARAMMPMDEASGLDTSPIGAAIDFTGSQPVAKPFAGISECPPMPIVWVLNNLGRLVAWNVVSRDAIDEDAKLNVPQTAEALVMEAESKEKSKEEPEEQPKEPEVNPEVKPKQPEQPKEPEVKPEVKPQEPQAKTSPQEATSESIHLEGPDAPLLEQLASEEPQEPKQPEPTESAKEPQGIAARFGKPSSLGSFGEPLKSEFGKDFKFAPGESHKPKEKEPPKELPTASDSASKASPFASFTNKPMTDAFKPTPGSVFDSFRDQSSVATAKTSDKSTENADKSADFFNFKSEDKPADTTKDTTKDYSALDIGSRLGLRSEASSGEYSDEDEQQEDSEDVDRTPDSSPSESGDGYYSSEAEDSEAREGEDASEDVSDDSYERISSPQQVEPSASSSPHDEDSHPAASLSTEAPKFQFGQPSGAPAFSFGQSTFGQSAFGQSSVPPKLDFGLAQPKAQPVPKLDPKSPVESLSSPEIIEKEPSPEPVLVFDDVNSTDCEQPCDGSIKALKPLQYPDLGTLDQVYAETNSLFQVINNNICVLQQRISEQSLSQVRPNDLMQFDKWHISDAQYLATLIDDNAEAVDQKAARNPEIESLQPLLDSLEEVTYDLRQLGAAVESMDSGISRQASEFYAMPVRSSQLQYSLRQKLSNVRALLQQAEENYTYLRVQHGEVPDNANLNLAADMISRKIARITEKYPKIFSSSSHAVEFNDTPLDFFDRQKFLEGNARAKSLKRLGAILRSRDPSQVIS